MEELKPCPHCGATHESCAVRVQVEHYVWDDVKKFTVICEDCGAEIGEFETREEAIEAWNRRIE